MSRKRKKPKWDVGWAKAKTLCRLSADDVRKAKKLGMRPRALIGNIPSPSQQWKAPVRFWLRDLYAKGALWPKEVA